MMIEKAYDVTMNVRKKGELLDGWTSKIFRVFERTEEFAKIRALISATKYYPIEEGWGNMIIKT